MKQIKDQQQESNGYCGIASQSNNNVKDKQETGITSEAEGQGKLKFQAAAGAIIQKQDHDDVQNADQSGNSAEQEHQDGDGIEEPNFRQDLHSIALLFFLYVLQGIPLGLMSTIPLLLQSRKVPYTEQAKFSIVHWPFSFKILYAPIVDAIYFERFGRRKSWLIPLQYLIAIFLFIMSFQIDAMLDSANINALTAAFFILCFLTATQDITVDGWGVSMLHPKNVGYASSCNVVGQALGVTISYSGFLALNSAEFANEYFRSLDSYSETGLVSLQQFLFFWAIVFALTNTLILLFKIEAQESQSTSDQRGSILKSYRNLLKILKLRNMQILILFLFTVAIGFGSSDALTYLKLVEKGVPKERVAFFSIPLIPVKLLIPLVLSKYIAGPNPMNVFIIVFPFSLVLGLLVPLFVLWTPAFRQDGDNNNDNSFTPTFYVLLFIVLAIHLIPNLAMRVSKMAFVAKISDPAIGGTYVTLVSTCSNAGSMWVHTVSLWLVDYVAIPLGNMCLGGIWDVLFRNSRATTTVVGKYHGVSVTDTKAIDEVMLLSNRSANNSYYTYFGSTTPASKSPLVHQPASSSSTCSNVIDGFYIECFVGFCIGLVWFLTWGKRAIQKLQRSPVSSWRIFH